MKTSVPLLVSLCLVVASSRAQYSSSKTNRVEVSGYIKDLQWMRMEHQPALSTYTQLLHQRLNTLWRIGQGWSARAEFRTRYFYGSDVERQPSFAEALEREQEGEKLFLQPVVRDESVLHINTERLYLEYSNEVMNLRAGRQRINWGMNSSWNPNDIFNTYNLLDFDYEERPGRDAVRWQYIIDEQTGVECALASGKSRPTGAMKLHTHLKTYDLQLLAGIYDGRASIGFGWAGNISEVGFKGEAQWYNGTMLRDQSLNISTEFDYMTSSGWYLLLSGLYNRNGKNSPLPATAFASIGLQPENPMPGRWNVLGSVSKDIHPFIGFTVSLIYAPGVALTALSSSLRFSYIDNLDFDLIVQAFSWQEADHQRFSETLFFRARYSF